MYGYNIYMSEVDIDSIAIKENIKIFTYLSVKENEMKLHGFLTQEKLSIFKKLIEVSGVGPRAGKNILAQMTPEDVCLAIATSDVKALVKISGVGPKMAQRIILELKDKISNEQIVDNKQMRIETNETKEAIIALQVLGYTQKQSEEAVEVAAKSETTVEKIIKKALIFVSKK